MKTYYSTDDENYCYETLGDVFDAMESDGLLVAGAIYWEADFLPMEPQQALTAAQVLEEADERGYDLIGESWDNPFSVPRDAQMELQSLLDAWAAKHVDVSHYYTMVGKQRQLEVTEADLPANVRGKLAPTAGRQARATENVHRTCGSGLVACRWCSA